MKEWGFDEDSENVDIDRMYEELTNLLVIEIQAYLNALKRNAPIVYSRFACKYKSIGCIKITNEDLK